MANPKYKIGSWVVLGGCGDKLKMRVVGILEETCSAGKQIHYSCRQFIKERAYTTMSEKKYDWYPASNKEGLEIRRYNEIELVPYKEEK